MNTLKCTCQYDEAKKVISASGLVHSKNCPARGYEDEDWDNTRVWGTRRSVCCKAPMTNGCQCLACGADGRTDAQKEEDQYEKEELVNEKIRFETNQQS